MFVSLIHIYEVTYNILNKYINSWLQRQKGDLSIKVDQLKGRILLELFLQINDCQWVNLKVECLVLVVQTK